MTNEHDEAVRLAEMHGAEHRFEHNGTVEVLRFEPWQLSALIVDVRRDEREKCISDLGRMNIRRSDATVIADARDLLRAKLEK